MLDENIHGDVVAALAAKHSMSRRFEIRVWAADQTSRLQVSYGPKRAVSSPSISTSPIRAASPQRNTPGSLFCDWGPRATRSPACPDSSKKPPMSRAGCGLSRTGAPESGLRGRCRSGRPGNTMSGARPQAELLHLDLEAPAREAETLGCTGHVSARCIEGGADEAAFGGLAGGALETGLRGCGGAGGGREIEVIGPDQRPARQQHGALDGVLQLPHVAWRGAPAQHGDRFGADGGARDSEPLRLNATSFRPPGRHSDDGPVRYPEWGRPPGISRGRISDP